MKSGRRDLIAILMVIFLVILSFGAGFLVNELVRGEFGARPSQSMEEQFGVFWEAWDRVEDNFIGVFPTDSEVTYGAAHGAIDTLEDPYTLFVEPVERELERERLRGNFGGVGVELRRTEEGVFVMQPIPGNPAEAAGILPEDILLAVDGHELTPETTVQEVADLVRGEEGTDVVLTVRHDAGGGPVDITVTRAAILLPSVSYRILDEDETIGYIRLSRFTGESGQEIETAIESLFAEGAEKLILDLRNNGGGLRDSAVDVSDHFLDGGVVVYQQNKDGDEESYRANRGETAEEAALVVLVNEATASAAEIVAGAMQDRERAVLIGQPTFGKGSVQLVFDLSDGSSVHVTSARWLTPDKRQLDLEGLQPDILVEVTTEAVESGLDETLASAVSYLQEK